jgi:hypothetical protein
MMALIDSWLLNNRAIIVFVARGGEKIKELVLACVLSSLMAPKKYSMDLFLTDSATKPSCFSTLNPPLSWNYYTQLLPNQGTSFG